MSSSLAPCRFGDSCRFLQTNSCRFYHATAAQPAAPVPAAPSASTAAQSSSSSSQNFSTGLGGGAAKPPSIHALGTSAQLLVIGGLASELKGDWFANDTVKFLRSQGYAAIDLVAFDEDVSPVLVSQNQHAAVVVCWHESHPSFARSSATQQALSDFVGNGGLLFFYGPGGPKLEGIFSNWFHKPWKVPNLRFRPRFLFDLAVPADQADCLPVDYRVKANPAVAVDPAESIYRLKEGVEVQQEFLSQALAPVAIARIASGTLVYIGDFNADEPSMLILHRLLKAPLQQSAV